MPAVGGSAGSFGALIVTPDMVPPDASIWDAQEQAYRAGATAWDGIHQQIVRDNAARRDAADSRGFDAAHEAGAILAEEAKTISEWHDGVARKAHGIAGVLRDTATAQEQLVRDADAKIQAAKLPGEREALVTAYHSQARVQTGWGVEAATALHTSFQASTENSRALSLLTKFGDMPSAPPAQPLDNTSPGIEQDEDPYRPTLDPQLDDQRPVPEALTDSSGTPATQAGVGPADQDGAGNGGVAGVPGPVTQSPAAAGAGRQASPLSGGVPSMSGMGGGGGMGSGGTPSMSGGLGSGGMPGVASSPLTGGLGEMPGAAGGLSSVGNVSGSAGAGSPAAAFSRGMSSGAGIGGGMPVMPPNAPASPSPALSAGGSAVSAAPVSAAAAGGGVSPGVVQPGVVAPAAPAGAGMGGGAPMMLPPGAMGPPAAAMPAAAAVPTIPAGTGGGGGGGGASPAATPASSATLIPASVVAAGQSAAARERRESADAAAAKELAWKLQHAAVCMNSAVTDWAVGVFRSPSGTETVITTNDGASFVPHSVYVPRSARLLAADPLVDGHFRQLWFGWHDPARVLVEYARMRSATGWRLVAAATTGAVSALRDAGVEHPPSCARDVNPLLRPGETVAAPALDGLHVHRLCLLWPDVYPRLLRVMDAAPVYQE
ncbi:MAG: hypothetical protein K0U78_21025, partial [Actinomycetia bacterium]|nr:hypothetical protein [Actinomycetes bacterium]